MPPQCALFKVNIMQATTLSIDPESLDKLMTSAYAIDSRHEFDRLEIPTRPRISLHRATIVDISAALQMAALTLRVPVVLTEADRGSGFIAPASMTLAPREN